MINSINIQIRETNTDDFDSIMTVEKQAFGYDKEAQLVADLLADKTAEPMVSLLAFYKVRLSDTFSSPEPILMVREHYR